jgi:hypothetical protein
LFLPFWQRPDWFWGPRSLPPNSYQDTFPSVKSPGREADRTSPSDAEVKNAWSLEGVSKTSRTGRRERELQMEQLSDIRFSCIAILRVSPVSFAAITLCVASQRVFVVVVNSLSTQSGKFWIHPRMGDWKFIVTHFLNLGNRWR